jgi:hypothetical protein
MLFGKLFITTFTFAAMAIQHVACAPAAIPETSLVEKRNTPSSQFDQCYTDVQTHCNNIDNCIANHGDHIDVDVVGEIEVELQAIVGLLVSLCANLQVDLKVGISADEIHKCGSTLILIINLLCSILLKIYSVCTAAAITILVNVVVKLQAQIQLCVTLVLGCINGLLGGLLGLLLNVLVQLKIDLNVCLTAFLNACADFK